MLIVAGRPQVGPISFRGRVQEKFTKTAEAREHGTRSHHRAEAPGSEQKPTEASRSPLQPVKTHYHMMHRPTDLPHRTRTAVPPTSLMGYAPGKVLIQGSWFSSNKCKTAEINGDEHMVWNVRTWVGTSIRFNKCCALLHGTLAHGEHGHGLISAEFVALAGRTRARTSQTLRRPCARRRWSAPGAHPGRPLECKRIQNQLHAV